MEGFKVKFSAAQQKKLRETSKHVVKKETLPDGRVRVTGGKMLKATGSYSAGFGKRVARFLFKQKCKAP